MPDVVPDPNELVDVVDKDGNPSRVGRRWLERWPDDFTPINSDASASAQPDPTPVKEPKVAHPKEMKK